MAQKPLDLEAVLRLIGEGYTQAQIGDKLMCGNNRLSQAVVGLADEGLIIKRKERAWRGISTYELSLTGQQRVGQITPPQREPIAYARPAVNWDGSKVDEDRPAPMSAAEIAALRLTIPNGFVISAVKPHIFLPSTNMHPFYLNFRKVNLMRFASRADAVIAANRLAEAMRWYHSPRFLDTMRDILLSTDSVSSFYDNALQKRGLLWAN